VSQTLRPRTLFISACGGILVFGIVLAILGTVFGLPEMRARLHIGLAEQGNLILLLYLGIFCASLLVGPLIDRFGNKVNLCVSSVLVATAMIAFGSAHSFAAASLAAVLLGVGGGGLNTCTNALVSDVYGSQRGPMLNLLGIFFGIGALFVPLLAASLEGHFTIVQLFLFCSILSAACALAYGVIAFPPANAAQASSWRDVLGVARYEGLLLLAFILFFESGNEACIGGWTSTYVGATGRSPRTATLVLAAYWAALMLSRILAAQLLRRYRKSQLVLVVALISSAGCAYSAVRSIIADVVRRNSPDRIILRTHLPNRIGHRGRPLFQNGRDSFWIPVLRRFARRDVVPLGGGSSVPEGEHPCRHDCAVPWSSRNYDISGRSNVSRATIGGGRASRGKFLAVAKFVIGSLLEFKRESRCLTRLQSTSEERSAPRQSLTKTGTFSLAARWQLTSAHG
jgi:MFS family permease